MSWQYVADEPAGWQHGSVGSHGANTVHCGWSSNTCFAGLQMSAGITATPEYDQYEGR